MDEQERLMKLQAGKEALLAFQKKKKGGRKKKKHKPDTSVPVSLSYLTEESDGDSLLNQSEPILPSSIDGLPVPLDGGSFPSQTASLPPNTHLSGDGTTMQTKDPRPTQSAPDLPPSHSPPPPPITTTPHIHSTPLPPSHSHSPTPPTNSATHSHDHFLLHRDSQPNGDMRTQQLPSPVRPHHDDGRESAALRQELAEARETGKQLQAELDSLRERQALILEETRSVISRTYQDQLVGLQQSLVEGQRSHQSLERQLAEARKRHGSEIDSLRRQEEAVREAALQERDQKHAEHILRLTAELSAQQEFVDRDQGEQEAERIRLIKEGMKEMHEKEKTKLVETHEAEKVRLAEAHQQELASHTQQMEQLANSKIQEVHAQIMTAYRALAEQKNSSDSDLAGVREELRQTSSRLAVLEVERERLEEEHRRLLETHSAEVKEMNVNASNLEEWVTMWKEKAASLETRLQHSADSHESIQHLKQDYEARLEGLTAQFQERVAKLESDVREQRERNASLAEQLERAEEEGRQRHQEEVEELRSQHRSQVELLEKSMSEALSDKASLEAAEEHMSGLQKQLKAYRMQESGMNAKMARLQQEHAEVVELLRQRHEKERGEELESLRENYTSQIEELQRELQTAMEDKSDTGSEATDSALRELRSRHREELAHLRTTLQEAQTKALENLQAQLLQDHLANVEVLKQEHKREMEQLKVELESASEQLEAEGKAKFTELKESHRAELSRLQTEHHEAITELQRAIEQQQSDSLGEANSQIEDLKSELEVLSNREAEMQELHGDMMSKLETSQREIERGRDLLSQAESTENQLREQCLELSGRLQSAESDCHVAQSARATAEQSLAVAQSQLEELTAQVDRLQAEAGNLEDMEAAGREQADKLLRITDQLAEKNVTIASLQSETDTLNTEVFSLSRKCQQQASTVEMLQRQLENVGAVSEEIATLQRQLSELAPVQEHNARLQNTVAQLEAAVQSKDGAIGELQSKLEQVQGQVSCLEAAVQSKEGELGLLQTQLQEHGRVVEEAEQLRSALQTKDAEIKPLKENGARAGLQIRELQAQWDARLEQAAASSTREIEALKAQNESGCVRERELREQVQQQGMSLAQLEATHQAQQEELSSAKEELRRLKEQLREALTSSAQLQHDKQTLAAELQTLQEQSATSVPSDSLAEMRSKNEELEQSLTDFETERERLAAELARAQEDSDTLVQECTRSWERKVQQLEQTIRDLQTQLGAKDLAYTEMQNQFNQKLAEADIQQQSLLRRSRDSSQLHSSHDESLMGGQRSALEESLSRARRRLTDKVREKETLEKDLSFHCTELERRLGEKQRLEELLFEKARFEQELVNQKEQLQSDLMQIESKLHLHVGGRAGQQYSNHMVTPANQRVLTHS